MAPTLTTWFLQLGNTGAARNAAAACAERRAAEARAEALLRRFTQATTVSATSRRVTPHPAA